MKMRKTFLLSAIAALGFSLTAHAAPAPKLALTDISQLPIVEMHVYDEDANADKQVDAAFAKAKKAHKRVLLDLGGNWCPDCVVLHNLMLLPDVQKFVDAHYEVVMVDIGRYDRNGQIAARFGYTKKLEGAPTILVVDPKSSKVINADNIYALRTARDWKPQALADYLARYTE